MASIKEAEMKLIFVATRNNNQTVRFQELVSRCIQKLECDIKQHIRTTIRFNEPIPIGTNNEYCRFDCSVVIQSHGQTLWIFFSSASEFLSSEMKKFAEKHSTDDLQFRTSVQVQDRAFFDIQLKGADLQVRANNIRFGNLIKHDSFITHYIVDDDPRNGWYGTPDIMKRYFGNQYNGDEKHTMYIDFEHDWRRLTIVFPLKLTEQIRDPDQNNQKVIKTDAVAKLVINYSSIRRIFCDFERTEQTDHSSSNLYLHLKCPPLISIVKFARRNKNGELVEQVNLRSVMGDRYTHWIPKTNYKDMRGDVLAVADSPYLMIRFDKHAMENCVHVLGRLFAANQKPIEIRQIGLYNDSLLAWSKYQESPLKDRDLRRVLMRNNEEDFAVIYMIDALLSRGAHVKDQLLVEETHCLKFIKRLKEVYKENRRLTLNSLERLLNFVDEQLDMRPLYEMFDEAIENTRRALEAQTEDLTDKKGYIRLRKVTITPTRRIFEAPELIMGNRVLRVDPDNFPPERFLRVAFRDDDWSRIQANIGAKFIENFVKHDLEKGIIVADYYFSVGKEKQRRIFNYLGSSNSQMREQGCYFIQADTEAINKFRQRMGQFKTESVPKYMARFGQCFTQSQALSKDLERSSYNYTHEFVDLDSKGKEYTFSDGVGRMSAAFAGEIAKELNLGNFIPSCIQFRYSGFKGVVTLNKNMDILKNWAEKHYIDESKLKINHRFYFTDLLFRDSQCKFRAPQDNQRFEVVKFSGPSAVTLNKPMINILDQVSAMQGYECHMRVTSRILSLLSKQLQSIANTMTDEHAARNRLGEFPRVVMYDVLQNVNLTQEPFFLSMLRMAARCTLKKLRTKLQIAIPSELGRSMLGVVDETGLLNYGQVFIRYTVNVQQKRPGPEAARRTITGRVLVTKNPMIVAGDIRMFEAVDIPALHDMCDVIVFPRNGPRPHPDEMAGSDLDGDEYSVIWDPAMYLDRNESAFDYSPAAITPTEVNEEQLQKQMSDFYVTYMTHDSVGKLATAHLVNADIYGIDSDVCDAVAKKHMQAVDFPKTGQPATRLEKANPVTNSPNEDPPRIPDFKDQLFKPTYISPRLNGRVFRRIKEIDDVLEISIDDQLNTAPKMDEMIDFDGISDEDMEIAQNNFNSYKAVVENLLQRFGINSEVEIFSNSYSTMRKRISEKEEDDFSFFNTQRIIEEEIENIYSTHRRRLFETHGTDFGDQVEWPYKTSRNNERESRIVLRSVVHEPSDKLKRLAVAYYRVAYSQDNQKHLSFAWLGADILFKVRQNKIQERRQQLTNSNRDRITNSSLMPPIANFSFDPLSKRVSEHMEIFIAARPNSFNVFCTKIAKNTKQCEAMYLIRAYCERHQGLAELLYFCYKWARQNNLLIDEPKRSPKELEKMISERDFPTYTMLTICLTFLQFGLDTFDGVKTSYNPFLVETKVYKRSQDIRVGVGDPNLIDEVNLKEQHGGLGKKFIQFLGFLSTLDFARIRRQSFAKFKHYVVFAQQQHVKLHKAAEKSYYLLCFSEDFSTLPYSNSEQSDLVNRKRDLDKTRPAVDGESFIFELPKSANIYFDDNRLQKIREKTGVYRLFVRSLPGKEEDVTTRFMITVSSSLEAMNSLRRLLSPTGYINCQLYEVMLANALSSQVLYRLSEIDPSIKEELERKELMGRRKLLKNRI